jgi:acyl carrier protein phosphodiesterase
LAHAFLAGDDPGMVLGGLLGDYVKGRLTRQFEPEIMHGIRLHRWVDAYTDAHPVTRVSRNRFAPPWRRFAGIIVDVCYDHFLARHWPRFADTPLDEFCERVYRILLDNHHRLPPRLQAFAPHMVGEHLLGAYRRLDAVERTLQRLSRRFKRPTDLSLAMAQVRCHYPRLEDDFLAFFPDVSRRSLIWAGGPCD